MGLYRQRNFAQFDVNAQLIAGRAMDLDEHQLKGGDKIPMSTDEGVRRRLWMVEWAHYESDWTPTPELPSNEPGLEWMDPADGVAVTAGDNGWFEVKADWAAEAEKVHGAEAAETRARELREAGDDKGITYAHSGGGWYLITGTGIEAPGLKVKGEEAAAAKAQELRDAIPPKTPAEPEPPEGGEGGGKGDDAEA